MKPLGSSQMEATKQNEDILALSKKYDKILLEKVSVYNELLESLKELVRRQKVFRKNQIDEAFYKNESSILKRKMEQKESVLQEAGTGYVDNLVGEVKKLNDEMGDQREQIQEKEEQINLLQGVLNKK